MTPTTLFYDDNRACVCFTVFIGDEPFQCYITEKALRYCFDVNSMPGDAAIRVFMDNQLEIHGAAVHVIRQVNRERMLTTKDFPGKIASNAKNA